MLVFPSTSEEAVDVYEALREKLHTTGLQLMSKIPPQALDLGSNPLQQVRHTCCTLRKNVTCFADSLIQSKKK